MRYLLIGCVLSVVATLGCASKGQGEAERQSWRCVYRSRSVSSNARIPYRHMPHESRPVNMARCEIINGEAVELSLLDSDDIIENSMLTLRSPWNMRGSHVHLSDTWSVQPPGAKGQIYTVATALIFARPKHFGRAVVTIYHYADFDVDAYLSEITDDGSDKWGSEIPFLRSLKDRRKIEVIEIEF